MKEEFENDRNRDNIPDKIKIIIYRGVKSIANFYITSNYKGSIY
jgi:hypothetical protein